MIENSLKIAVDPFFPPPDPLLQKRKIYQSDNVFSQNKYDLVYD